MARRLFKFPTRINLLLNTKFWIQTFANETMLETHSVLVSAECDFQLASASEKSLCLCSELRNIYLSIFCSVFINEKVLSANNVRLSTRDLMIIKNSRRFCYATTFQLRSDLDSKVEKLAK